MQVNKDIVKQYTVKIFFSGSYPGYGAASNRVKNYVIGLKAASCNVSVVSFSVKGRRINPINNLIHLYSLLINTILARQTTDVIVGYGLSWMPLLFIRMGLCFSGVKLVLELNEKPGTCYTNWLFDLYVLRKINYIMTVYVAFPLSDGFIVISRALEKYIQKFKSKNAKVVRIPVLVNVEDNVFVRVANIEPQKPFMLHAGALSDRKDGIINVFKAFARVCKERNYSFHFYLTSKIAPRNVLSEINNIIELDSLENNVHFLGDIPAEDLFEFQKECSLIVINKPVNEQNIYNFPTKVAESLFLGIPIIASQVGELPFYLTDNVNSLLLKDDTSDSIVNKINLVLDSPQLIEKIVKAGRKTAVEHFDAVRHALELRFFFDKLLR